MDDVDRLFECFKCGISPPQSALKEKRSSREGPSHGESSSSPRHQMKKATQLQLSNNKLDSLGRGKQFSPVIFYGSPHGVPPKRPVSLLRLLREIHVDLAAQSKQKFRDQQVWATFPRQDEAMKFLKGHGHGNVHVFSYQDHFNGQRRFLVSTYDEFWRRYKCMDSKIRHHYEVIQEGLPCHLYFDLEFNKRDNAEKNGDVMVDILIKLVLATLLEKYSIQGSEEWVVELDSSTQDKFSRHLIIRIPMTAFKDNLHVGAFVAEICSRVTRDRDINREFQELFVKNDSKSQLFVDTAVYSRNRCFRLFLSSKAGKKSFLLPSESFKCKGLSEEEIFMQSLICNIDLDCKKLLVCKMDLDCIKTLQYDTEVNHNFKNEHYRAHQALNACTTDASVTYFMGKSPFPTLDIFIESVASTGDVSGKIRSWYWFSEYGVMVYSMLRNRYCERIGRQHKSNNVMYVVDLRRAGYYQKCYDPDCKGYRSPLRYIPQDVFMSISGSLQMVHSEGSQDNMAESVYFGDENSLDGYSEDSWWLEAVKVADDVECKHQLLDHSTVKENKEDDVDENWWMDVERTASQNELIRDSV